MAETKKGQGAVRRGLTREEALEYHSREPQGKIQVVPTKPTSSQRDLSLAYTPGVAHACRGVTQGRSRPRPGAAGFSKPGRRPSGSYPSGEAARTRGVAVAGLGAGRRTALVCPR